MSELQDWKRDGFRGEKMIVLPTESFQDYVEHPLVRRLYLTDVGIFPARNIISENEKTELKSISIYIAWKAAEPSKSRNFEGGTEEYWGIGWYQSELEVPEEWLSGCVRLYFHSVYHDAKIYVNGELQENIRIPDIHLLQ